MMLSIAAGSVTGFGDYERIKFQKLIDVYNQHALKNKQKDKYYEGKIALSEVNLGIALPDGMRGLEIGCSWGAKTVDVLAARSMFDGFVGMDGVEVSDLDELIVGNRLIAEYQKACRDELKYGCTFATLSSDPKLGCRIRFHSPQTAAALWDGEAGRIDCGFAVIDTIPSNENVLTWMPSLINFYTSDAIWILRRNKYAQHGPSAYGTAHMECY